VKGVRYVNLSLGKFSWVIYIGIVVPCSFEQLGILSLGQDSFDIPQGLPFGSSEIYLWKESTSAK